jgi:hypothetical protein
VLFTVFLVLLFITVIFGTGFSTKMFTPTKTLASAGWYNPSWGYRKEITVDHTKVPNTDQSNFPVLINLTDSDLQAHALSNGYDILFTDSTGTNKIPYQREQYTGGTGALVAWVKVATLSHTTDTVIYMYYGNAGAADQQDTTYAVWDSNFKGVWHLNETGSSPPIYDSTSNGKNSTANSTSPIASGKINGAATFNGTNSYVTFNPATMFWDYGTPHTFDFWVYINSFSTDHWPTVVNCVSSGYPFAIFLSDGGGGYSGYDGINISTAHNTFRTNDVSGQLIGAWNHIAVTYDGVNSSSMASLKVYLNGVLQPLRIAGGWDAYNLNYIGTDGYAGDFIDGFLDEPRLSNTVRSADWIQTEYNNQNNSSAFYSLGSEIIRDTTPPTVDLIFPSPGPGATSFQAVFSKDMAKPEAENPANYFLHNWPGAGGSGDLVGDATINYDAGTKTATINLTNPSRYISPEQQWGVENIHDLFGNLLAVSPYSEYSAPMVAPVTTSSGIDANWHNTAVTVSFNCTDMAGSGCYKTYYSIDSASFIEGTSVILSTNGQHTVAFYSVDNAGNAENTHTAGQTVNIDITPPTVPGVPVATIGTDLTSQNWTWTVSGDTGSGMKQYDWRIETGPSGTTTVPNLTTNLPVGIWKLYVKAKDNAGNFSSENLSTLAVLSSSIHTVVVDCSAPLIAVVVPAADVSNPVIDLTPVATTIGDLTVATLNCKLHLETILPSTTITVDVPATTTIQALTSLWTDKTIVPPIPAITTIPAPTGFSSQVNLAVEIGHPVAPLDITRGTRVFISGQAGHHLGYMSSGVFTEVVNTCANDSQVTGDALAAGTDCKIENGSDLVIWTKHFSSFITYDLVLASANTPSSNPPDANGTPAVSTTTPAVTVAAEPALFDVTSEPTPTRQNIILLVVLCAVSGILLALLLIFLFKRKKKRQVAK